MEEIIELLNFCRFLKYSHISLLLLTNSPNDNSNVAFQVVLTVPCADIIMSVMMNNILNMYGYSEDIILYNYYLCLDPANTSAWQQLSPSE